MVTDAGQDPLTHQVEQSRRWSYSRLRLTVLAGAFLLIAINPILNYYFQVDFIQGWYQSFGFGSLWFVSPLEGFESILVTKSFYIPSLVAMAIPITVAILLGRVFCSWICPVTFLLEIFDRLRRIIARKTYLHNRLVVAKRVLWFTLVGELVVSMVLGAPLFVFLSPPGLVGRELMMLVFFKKLALEGLLLAVVIILELVTRRFFCRSFCPLGAFLALLGLRRKLRVVPHPENCVSCRICEKRCPMGLAPHSGEGISPYCWNCGECIDGCNYQSLSFRWITRAQSDALERRDKKM